MLAQNFKTATALGITDAEFDAFLKTLGLLEREEGDLDMARLPVMTDRECKTPCCIWGWANRFGARDIKPHRNPALVDLFFMRSAHGYWRNVTRAQGAIALRNYLTHGEARWSEALSA